MSTTDAHAHVLVPAPDPHHPATAHILPASGLITLTDPHDSPMLLVDYEGDRYATTPGRWADRIARAHGRQRERYPTVARQLIPAHLLLQVGRYDPLEGAVTLTVDPHDPALTQWLGHSPTPEDLQATGARFQQRAELRAALANPQIPRQAVREMARRWGHHDLA